MTLGEFFWLDDAKFAAALTQASNEELMFGDKHNVRKRKGGKLGAWLGSAQAPFTMGVSLLGTGISARNCIVAKRRLAMIHDELARRGLPQHTENWKDAAFASLAVGTGAVVGMGFVPGVEFAAHEIIAVGMTTTATYLTGVATSEACQNVGAFATETATMKWSDPDGWRRKPAPQKFVDLAEHKLAYATTYEVVDPMCLQNPYYPPPPRY